MRTETEVAFTPKAAAWLLKHRHDNQRVLRSTTLAMYRKHMREGLYPPQLSVPICVSGDSLDRPGVLWNGYHRLTAQVKEDIDMTYHVSFGVPEALVPLMDSGSNRTLAEHLTYAYGQELPEARIMASMLKSLMTYDGKRVPQFSGPKTDPMEAVEFGLAHMDRLRTAARIAAKVVRKDREGRGDAAATTNATLGFVIALTLGTEGVERFWSEYAEDTVESYDPRRDLMRYMLREENRFPKGARANAAAVRRTALLSATWNAYTTDTDWQPWNGKADSFPHPVQAVPFVCP